jgi:hypothetical protein
MVWEFEYHANSDYLEAKVAGELTDAGLTKMAGERWAMLQRLRCRKILFNFTQAINALEISEIHARPGETEKVGIQRVNRTAALVPAAELPKYRFMETVYRNRGFDLNVFTDRAAAEAYLAAE